MELKNSAPGPDGIPASIIKDSLPFFAPVLTHIVNLSLQQGIFPNELKIARIIPLYKSGNKKSANNYRPISLLPSFSKIFEKIMANRLTTFLTNHNILYKYQFGFRPRHTTSMAINLLVDKITESLDANRSLVGVALDFRKAFDTVNYEILLKKLYAYGIRGTVHTWFDNYLSDRFNYVSIDHATSPFLQIQCGVPQGSILGPILFLLYINDLPQCSELFPIIFADDTNVFCSGRDVNDCMRIMNSELCKLNFWICSNKLSLNVDKSHFIVFSKSKTPTIPLLSVDGKEINRVNSIKFLGVFIDDRLSWDCHVRHIRGKISRSIGVLSRSKHLLSAATLKTLYYAFIQPYLSYCIDVWGQCNESLFQSVFRLQKKAIRLITFSNRNAHTTTLFKSLEILTLRNIYIASIAVFMFKYHLRRLPPVIDELFTLNSHIHTINTRQRNLLHGPLLRSKFSEKSIRFRGTLIWNQIPGNFDVDVSLNSFKSSLHSYLLNGGSLRLRPLS